MVSRHGRPRLPRSYCDFRKRLGLGGACAWSQTRREGELAARCPMLAAPGEGKGGRREGGGKMREIPQCLRPGTETESATAHLVPFGFGGL